METKFITAEFHEGQMAYERGQEITSNPYLNDPTIGKLFWWDKGFTHALHQDVIKIKQLILNAARPIDKGTMH